MMEQLDEQKLLNILQEVQKLGESDGNITSKDLVKEIEKMLLLKENASV